MTLSDWMSSAITPGSFSPPGLAIAINDAVEVCGIDGAGVPVTAASIWPLGCLAKIPIADSAVRTLDLDRRISTWLPETRSDVTVRQLLTHTAGLPLDLPGSLYGSIDRDRVREVMIALAPDRAPGVAVSYSNIGYGWIALALERVTGQSLSDIFRRHDLTWGDESAAPPVVVTDVRRSRHAETVIEPINSAYWRSLHLPWCGAFGTIQAIQRSIQHVHPLVHSCCVHASGGFPAGAYFGHAETDGCIWEDAAWGCGVECRGTKKPHWITPASSPDSYGHIGSSGVLAWKDGATTLVVAGPRTTDGGWMLRHGPRASMFAFNQHARPKNDALLGHGHNDVAASWSSHS